MKENNIGNISYSNITCKNINISTINQSIFLFNGTTQFVEINSLQISSCGSLGDILSFQNLQGKINIYGSVVFDNNNGSTLKFCFFINNFF